jgi:hypothetical protein
MKRDDQPLLLVLDTFEEVQFRSSAFVEELLDFLNDLQSRVPRLRTVLSGRAAILSRKYKVRPVPIGNFDREAAVAFLHNRGISNEEIAEKIFQQVGGSPLVLRLAADVAKLENVNESGLGNLQTGWFSLFREKSIEVVLYKRILSHVYDARAKDLAYPGLVLRILTPEILLKVLAPACRVPVASFEDARVLVHTLREQLGTLLVATVGDDERLIHRPDMRAILLQDVNDKAKKDKEIAARLQAIHQAAVTYYSGSKTPVDRAEEIYHRLALGIDRPFLHSRWMEGLKPFLGSSIRELPPKSQGYLAARLSLELEPDTWAQADDEDWAIYASRVVVDLIRINKPFDALRILLQRGKIWASRSYRSILNAIADEIFGYYTRQYEDIRKTQEPGDARTRNMTDVVENIARIGRALPIPTTYVLQMFERNTAGARIAALALAQAKPDSSFMDIAITAIQRALSPFEQFRALYLASLLIKQSSSQQRRLLQKALNYQVGIQITESGPSRFRLKTSLLKNLSSLSITERGELEM